MARARLGLAQSKSDGFNDDLDINDVDVESEDDNNDDVTKIDWLSCNYVSDFDKNGFVYQLGTNFQKHEYQNPVLLGKMIVESSPVGYCKPIYYMVGRQSVECYLQPIKRPWIKIDFIEYQIRPTKYTLRHSPWDDELRTYTYNIY